MVLYTVASADEKGVAFEQLQGTFAPGQVRSFVDLSWAMTYASVQGRETGGSLCLYDTTNTHMTLKHLYVALSRAKKAKFVKVE